MARVTLATVAEALGVSTMTVSNAYNRPEKLSAELRERVLAKAEELGYAGPDAVARSLRRGKTGVLGVVLGEALVYAFEDPATVEFFRGLAGAGIPLHLVPATGGEGDSALVFDAAVDALHPLRAARRPPARRRGRRGAGCRSSSRAGRSCPVTRSWRSTSARPARPPSRTCARSATSGSAVLSLPWEIADRADRPLRAGGRHIASPAAGSRATACTAGREVALERPRARRGGGGRAARRPRAADRAAVHERRTGGRRAARRRRARHRASRASSRSSASTTRPRPRAPIRR